MQIDHVDRLVLGGGDALRTAIDVGEAEPAAEAALAARRAEGAQAAAAADRQRGGGQGAQLGLQRGHGTQCIPQLRKKQLFAFVQPQPAHTQFS